MMPISCRLQMQSGQRWAILFTMSWLSKYKSDWINSIPKLTEITDKNRYFIQILISRLWYFQSIIPHDGDSASLNIAVIAVVASAKTNHLVITGNNNTQSLRSRWSTYTPITWFDPRHLITSVLMRSPKKLGLRLIRVRVARLSICRMPNNV